MAKPAETLAPPPPTRGATTPPALKARQRRPSRRRKRVRKRVRKILTLTLTLSPRKRVAGVAGPLTDATLLPGRRHGRRVVVAAIASSSPSPSPSSSRRRRPRPRRRVIAAVAGPRRRVPRAGPVGAPRAVMNIKHPCKPKPVCRGIPTAILLQDGWQDFKCAGITLVYTRYIPGLEIADSEKISLVYPSHILFT